MVGLSIACSTVGGVFRRSSVVGSDAALMPPSGRFCRRSSPAQKARPLPVRITQRTAGSSLACSRRWVSALSIGPEIVFMRSGALSVMTAMCSATA